MWKTVVLKIYIWKIVLRRYADKNSVDRKLKSWILFYDKIYKNNVFEVLKRGEKYCREPL